MNLNQRELQLRDIQRVSFMVDDVSLFLDTHPEDKNALAYFKHYQDLGKKMMAEYEATYGPLLISNTNVNEGWKWLNQPWPWELEA